MISLYDLHTHCTYCDGDNTAEEMVLAAIEKGFSCIGFSSHSYTHFDTEYCMAEDVPPRYAQEIRALKEKYKGKIDIFLGCEQDFFSEPSEVKFDYLIGSVHYLNPESECFIPVDLSREELSEGVKKYYGGDFYKAAAEYFSQVSKLYEKCRPDIIGHFDLIAKFNEGGVLFDEGDRRYLFPALEAAEVLLEKGVLFEINTGAMVRGYRSEPYPSAKILKHIAEKKGGIVLSGDTHNANYLGTKFSDAVNFALFCGFSSAYVLTENGFEEVSLL